MIVESYEDSIVLSGELRSNFWDTVHTAISLALRRHPEGVIIDCSGITYANAAGADTFRDVMRFISKSDARVIVAAVPEAIRDVLKSVPEVRSQLAIATTVDEARHSLYALENPEAKKRRKTAGQVGLRKLLVCLGSPEGDVQLLKTTRRIAQAMPAEVVLIYPILVPRDLPIHSPLPDQESAGTASLQQARTLLASTEVQYKVSLERGRDIASTIEDACEEHDASQVLIGLPDGPDTQDAALKLVRSMLIRIKKPLIFVRGDVG